MEINKIEELHKDIRIDLDKFKNGDNKMSQMYILTKDKETMHTYSDNVMVKNVKKGWRLIAIIRGWNMSISIDNEV